jgi:hypothetical protein
MPGYVKHAISLDIKGWTAPMILTFDTEISEERYIEVSDHSKDDEDDTCIEINKIIVNQPLNKQMTREKVKIVENNKFRKTGKLISLGQSIL